MTNTYQEPLCTENELPRGKGVDHSVDGTARGGGSAASGRKDGLRGAVPGGLGEGGPSDGSSRTQDVSCRVQFSGAANRSCSHLDAASGGRGNRGRCGPLSTPRSQRQTEGHQLREDTLRGVEFGSFLLFSSSSKPFEQFAAINNHAQRSNR